MSEKECTICYGAENFTVLECDHEYCVNCMREYISIKIDDAGADIFCPNEDCNKKISHDKIIDIISCDEELLEKYNKCVELRTNRLMSICPKCEKVFKKTSLNNSMECPSCDFTFCYICREKHYDYDNCPNEQDIDDEFLNIRDAHDEYTELKRCPLCRIIIEKTEGCSSIRCKSCYIKFCWSCLATCSDIRRMEEHTCSNYDGYIETNSDDEYWSGDES